jgi:hypothetical protein
MATFSTPDIYHALGGALEQLLAAMTNGALECAGKRSTDLDEQYGAEAFDLLVDAWGSLLAHTYFPKGVYDACSLHPVAALMLRVQRCAQAYCKLGNAVHILE